MTAGWGRSLVGPVRLLDVLAAEAELMAGSAVGQRPHAQVPACPGLTLGETVRHVGSTYRMVVSWLRDGRQPGQWAHQPGPGEELAEFLRVGARDVFAELAAHDPTEAAPTWWPADPTYGFWRRRLAHETTVHRVDVQGAAGVPLTPIDDDVALDGVDEVLTLWFSHRLAVRGITGTTPGTVAIRCDDDVWLARAGPGGSATWRVTPEQAAEADALVSGAPMAVYLWLWGRVPDRWVTIDGNPDIAAQLWALLRLATR